jgi:hypothetical protein
MHPAFLLVTGAAGLMAVLGGLHLRYTYWGDKLDPRDRALREAMQRTHLVITRQTTVWHAVKGFNASHGLGLVAFGLSYGFLASQRPDVLGGSPFLLALGMAVLLAYLALARRYFFSVPYRAVALACALYAAGWALS